MFTNFFYHLLLLIGCNTDSDVVVQDLEFQLDELITLRSSTNMVSPHLYNMGVTEINVSNSGNNDLEYNFTALKEFGMNKESINMSDFTVIYQDNAIFLKENPEVKVSIYQNSPYILSPLHTGSMDSDYLYENKTINILLFTLKEITTAQGLKIDTKIALNEANLSGKACSFWDTYYVTASAGSRSTSQAKLVEETAYREGPYNTRNVHGCSKIGGPDTSCLWENHLCISTQAYCCN